MSDIENAIIQEARTWLGTPFKHQGRLKGQGVDCLGLLVGVAAALRLRGRDGLPLTSRDSLAYGHYPDEAALRDGLKRCLTPIVEWEKKRGQYVRASFKRDPGLVPGKQPIVRVVGERGGNQKKDIPNPIGQSPCWAYSLGLPREGGVIHSASIGLFRIDGSARHLAIFANDAGYPTLIHAYAPARAVVEHRFCEEWQKKLVTRYRVP